MYYEFQFGNLFLILGVIALSKWLEDKLISQHTRQWLTDTVLASFLFAMLLFLHTEVVTFKNIGSGAYSFDWTFLNIQLVLYIFMAVTVRSGVGRGFLIGVGLLFYWERGFFAYWYSWPTLIAALAIAMVISHFGEQLLKHVWQIYLSAVVMCIPVWIAVGTATDGDQLGDWAVNFAIFSGQFILVNAFNVRLRRDYNRELMLTKQANFDDLTGIKNFRAFNNDLSQQYDEFKETQNQFILVMMDIDHFKAINDTYGHLVGNSVLKQTATALNELAKEADPDAYAYRVGGEEFGILLPVKPGDELWTRRLCQQIQTKIRQQRLMLPKTTINWTISIGCDYSSLKDEGCLEIYRRADKNLYHSKENGRDAITIQGTMMEG